jgi:uncharacterized membrane protein YbhN (UPF0104 family)
MSGNARGRWWRVAGSAWDRLPRFRRRPVPPAPLPPEDGLPAASRLDPPPGQPWTRWRPRRPTLRWPWRSGTRSSWRLPGGLRPWVTCLSLGFLVAALLSHGQQMRQYNLDPQGWLWLLMGVGCSVLSLVVSGLAWVVILRWLGLRPRPTPVVALYILTNLRKFLPGGIWHLASRVQALRQPSAALGVPLSTRSALLTVLIEPLLAAVAALALVSLGGWQNGLGPLALLPLALLTPRWLHPLLRRLERGKAARLGLSESAAAPDSASGSAPDADVLADDAPETREPASSLKATPTKAYPWLPLLAQLAFVLLRFAGLACCIWALDLQQTLPWLTWLSAFALAWTIGLVVPGAPGGLGVFEAALLLRLSGMAPEPAVLAIALSYRLVVTGADLLAAGLVGLDEKLTLPLDGRSA